MLISSGGINNNDCGCRSGVLLSQARKKTRRVVSTTATRSEEECYADNQLRLSTLHVDVTSSRLASSRWDSSFRRSPIAFNDLVGDECVNGTSDNLVDSEEPFVLARKLLRRRHVRKEQLRKTREAEEEEKVTETRDRRKRKATSGCGVHRRSSVLTDAVVDAPGGDLPQLSPVILKSDSFSSISRVSTKEDKYSGAHHHVWTIEVGDSPPKSNTSKSVDAPDSVAADDAPPVAFITFPRKKETNSTNSVFRVSISPLRSRSSI